MIGDRHKKSAKCFLRAFYFVFLGAGSLRSFGIGGLVRTKGVQHISGHRAVIALCLGVFKGRSAGWIV